MLHAVRQAAKRFASQVKLASTPRGYSFRQELLLWNFTDDTTVGNWDCICDVDIGGQSLATLCPNGIGWQIFEYTLGEMMDSLFNVKWVGLAFSSLSCL